MNRDNYGIELIKGFSGKVLATIVGFIGSIIFARVLGPSGLGMFFLLMFVVRYSKQCVEGFMTASKRYYTHNSKNKTEVVTISFIFVFVTTIVASGFVFVFEEFIKQYTGYSQSVLVPFLMVFFSLSLTSAGQVFTTGEGKFGNTELINVGRSILTVILQVGFVLYFGSSIWMAYGLAVGNFIILPVYLTQFEYGFTKPAKETIMDVLHYAKYSIPNGYVGKSFNRIDIFLLGVLSTSTIVGQYEMAARLTAPAMFVTFVTTNGLAAYISNSESQDKSREVEDFITDSLRYTSLLILPLLVGSLFIAEEVLVTVYGERFSEAAPFLIGFAVLKIVRTQLNPLITTVNATGDPDKNLKVSIVSLILIAPLAYGLFDFIGPIGIIISFIVVDAVRYMLLYKIVSERFEIKYPKQVIKQALAAVVMGVTLYPFTELFTFGSWFQILVFVGFGACIYFATLLGLDARFRDKLLELV